MVEQQAEAARIESEARSEWERRESLHGAAETSLRQVADLLHEEFMENTPASNPRFGPLEWSCGIDGCRLGIQLAKVAKMPMEDARYKPPFEIVSFASISVSIPTDFYGYEGRSHSLWFCDAIEEGTFRWFETAFMHLAGYGRSTVNPLSLIPDEEAFGALSNVTTSFQVAWPFTPIDQGDEVSLIERWMNWFADATEGKLEHPRQMPERSPYGSWRKE